MAELAGKAAPDVTQSILQRLSSVQIGELLLDEDALAEEVGHMSGHPMVATVIYSMNGDKNGWHVPHIDIMLKH